MVTEQGAGKILLLPQYSQFPGEDELASWDGNIRLRMRSINRPSST